MKVLPLGSVDSDPVATSVSGLMAQRTRMNTIANNLANAGTTRNARGEFQTYLRREVLMKTQAINPAKPDEQGVEVQAIVPMPSAVKRLYDPGHPEAGADGYRSEPDIRTARELTGMIEASRAYEANLNALKIVREALEKDMVILEPLPQTAI